MKLGELIKAAERRLKRVERTLAFDLLRGDNFGADKRRYRAYEQVSVGEYIATGEEVEFHRSLLPKDNPWYGATAPSQTFHWNDWTRLTVDRIGPDCVRVLLPGRGSHPMPVGDFVRAVVRGHIREPISAGPENAPT